MLSRMGMWGANDDGTFFRTGPPVRSDASTPTLHDWGRGGAGGGVWVQGTFFFARSGLMRMPEASRKSRHATAASANRLQPMPCMASV